MNFKQFLNPDWRKIVIFIIFLLLTFILVFGSFALPPSKRGEEYYIVLFLYYFLAFPIELTAYSDPVLGLLGFIINIFYLYLLSCFIVWIYDKFRKVNKK